MCTRACSIGGGSCWGGGRGVRGGGRRAGSESVCCVFGRQRKQRLQEGAGYKATAGGADHLAGR